MNTGSSKSLDSGAWRKLCAAVFSEVDQTKLPERIAEAEKALALRARELFYAAGDSTAEEEQALDDAVYALHALRKTSQTNHCIPPEVAIVRDVSQLTLEETPSQKAAIGKVRS